MKSKLPKRLGRTALTACLLLLLLSPVLLYTILSLGWPPVVGNLTAAGQLRTYAAQVYPDWEPEGFRAGYNLVDGLYYLDFRDGTETRSLCYDPDTKRVSDKQRSETLERELDIDGALRRSGLRQQGYDCLWGASWSPKTPEEAHITLRLDFYDPPEAPVPDEETMRERMAEEAMGAYTALAPLAPPDRFSVYYCHQALTAKDGGLQWYWITVDLPADTSLTREMVLAGKLEQG